jgi:hypothetical protein
VGPPTGKPLAVGRESYSIFPETQVCVTDLLNRTGSGRWPAPSECPCKMARIIEIARPPIAGFLAAGGKESKEFRVLVRGTAPPLTGAHASARGEPRGCSVRPAPNRRNSQSGREPIYEARPDPARSDVRGRDRHGQGRACPDGVRRSDPDPDRRRRVPGPQPGHQDALGDRAGVHAELGWGIPDAETRQRWTSGTTPAASR